MKNASAFIKTKKYPAHTQIVAVIDGAEPPSFKMLFSDWKNKNAQVSCINHILFLTACANKYLILTDFIFSYSYLNATWTVSEISDLAL